MFGDFCSGEIFTFPGGTASFNVLLDTSFNIVIVREDESGEIYVVGLGGTVHRITSELSAVLCLAHEPLRPTRRGSGHHRGRDRA